MEELDVIKVINDTELLMNKYNISTRDTWHGLNSINLDDFYANNNQWNGSRHFSIKMKKEGYSEVIAERRYSIPNYKSIAYNKFAIVIPERLSHLRHPFIHETVHFLQHNDDVSEKSYIRFNGNNYLDYIGQNSEMEAHFIQVAFIIKFENYLLEKLNNQDSDDINKQFSQIVNGMEKNKILNLIMMANRIKII